MLLLRIGLWLLSPPACTPRYPLLGLNQYDGLRKKEGGYGTPYLPNSETEKVKYQSKPAMGQLNFGKCHVQPSLPLSWQNIDFQQHKRIGKFCN